MLQVSDGLGWLEEYVELAKKFVPQVTKLSHIRKNSHRKDTIQRTAAKITYDTIKCTYAISLYIDYKALHKIKPKVIFMIKPYSLVDILGNLAHEISHIHHWTHTPKHKMLECKLLHLFMTKLFEGGYTSEEDELRGQKGWRC